MPKNSWFWVIWHFTRLFRHRILTNIIELLLKTPSLLTYFSHICHLPSIAVECDVILTKVEKLYFRKYIYSKKETKERKRYDVTNCYANNTCVILLSLPIILEKNLLKSIYIVKKNNKGGRALTYSWNFWIQIFLIAATQLSKIPNLENVTKCTWTWVSLS